MAKVLFLQDAFIKELRMRAQPLAGWLQIAGKEWRLEPYLFNRRRLLVDGWYIPPLAHVRDIARLGDLPIEELWILRSDLREVDGLPALPNLRGLYLVNGKIGQVRGLRRHHLERVWLPMNSIQDLGRLELPATVQYLDLGYNRIQSLRGLPRMDELIYLNLAMNPLQEISGLECFPHLRELWLPKHFELECAELVDALADLPELATIQFIEEAPSTDFSVQFHKPIPEESSLATFSATTENFPCGLYDFKLLTLQRANSPNDPTLIEAFRRKFYDRAYPRRLCLTELQRWFTVAAPICRTCHRPLNLARDLLQGNFGFFKSPRLVDGVFQVASESDLHNIFWECTCGGWISLDGTLTQVATNNFHNYPCRLSRYSLTLWERGHTRRTYDPIQGFLEVE